MIKNYSYSQLNTFNTCPEQYKIIYLDKNRKKHESIEAFVGRRVHGVLEWLYNDIKKSYISFDLICDMYNSIWKEQWHDNIYISDIRKNTAYYYSMGKECLSNYYRKYGPYFKQKVVETEVELKFMIDNYHFKGVIDRLDNPQTGNWAVHDYKTSKNIKSNKQALNDIQLALYHIAIEQNFNNVNNISLTWHFLRHGKEVTIVHEKDNLDKIKSKIIKNIKKIILLLDDKNNFIPKETFLCNWCYYWEECSVKLSKNPSRRAI